MPKITNNKGVAMIVATVMALIFLMLVITVSTVSTSAYKRAHFYKDRAIALNLAEAGIADALYRMNYREYSSGTYPSSSTSVSPWIPEGTPFSGNKGSYRVYFRYNPIIGATSAADIIYSAGYSGASFSGKMRLASVLVRGNNTSGNALNTSTHGIAEAFNKHAVYAKTATSPPTTTISGNVITESADPGAVAGRTWTEMAANTLGAVPAPDDIYGEITVDPGVKGNFTEYYENGWLSGVVDGTAFPATYGSYAEGTDTYSFSADPKTIANSLYIVAGTVGVDGPPFGNGITVGAVNGDANFTGTTTFSDFFKADGDISLSGTVTVNTNGALKGNWITVNNAQVTGSLLVRDSDLQFSTAASSIDSSGNTKKGAVLLYDAIGNNSLIIDTNMAPTITLRSDDSQAAIIVYSTLEITVANPVAINDAPVINLASGNQPAAIIAYSTTDNVQLTINASGDTINGLVYAGSGGDNTKNATVTLTDGTIGDTTLGGVIIAGGTVSAAASRANGTINLNGGTIRWRKRNYVSTGSIFQNFSGGQRVYLPVIGSWQEE